MTTLHAQLSMPAACQIRATASRSPRVSHVHNAPRLLKASHSTSANFEGKACKLQCSASLRKTGSVKSLKKESSVIAAPGAHSAVCALTAATTAVALFGFVPSSLAVSAAAEGVASVQMLWQVADIDANTANTLIDVFGPVLSLAQFLFILRIVMAWLPEVNDKEMPFALAYFPTEPILTVVRSVIKPVNGVDVSPVVMFALLSFLGEILVGPQGVLRLLAEKI